MSTTPISPAPGADNYVRGVRATTVQTGRVLRILALIGFLALVGAEIGVLVTVTDDRSLANKIHNHGVPVTATVTGCTGISSGVGMGIEYWQCRASYSLDGQTYVAAIRGSRSLLQAGDQMAAVAVPGDPGLLSTPRSAAREQSFWNAYLTPVILGGVIVVLGLASLLWVRRRRA
jgi:hypothetical protein